MVLLSFFSLFRDPFCQFFHMGGNHRSFHRAVSFPFFRPFLGGRRTLLSSLPRSLCSYRPASFIRFGLELRLHANSNFSPFARGQILLSITILGQQDQTSLFYFTLAHDIVVMFRSSLVSSKLTHSPGPYNAFSRFQFLFSL